MARVILKEGVKYLFVYGSLRVPEIRSALLGADKEHINGAKLYDHRPCRLHQRRYPALLAEKGHVTIGTLITGGITEDDWKILDLFEDEYIRTPVSVEIPKGSDGTTETKEAYTYMWPDPTDRMIRRDGSTWNLESFVARRDAIDDFLENTRRFRQLYLRDASSSDDSNSEDDTQAPSFIEKNSQE